MAFVQFSEVSLAFGARDILKDVSLNLASGSKAALAGPNGAGKSTLMKIVAGLLPPDSGERAVQKGTRVSYLAQSEAAFRDGTVREEAETAYREIEDLLERYEELGRRLEAADPADPKLAALVEEHHAIHETVEDSGYWRRSDRIREVLTGLGFAEAELDRPLAEFSGGWRMRVALARVILENPDIMLLDEPTNYLDLEARDWLEDYLRAFKGGFLVVSHDRSFLDATVREVHELWNGRLSLYKGDYTNYEKVRARELETLFASWERQQEEIAKLEDFIRRFRYNESKAALVQSRMKQLEKIVPIEIPEGMKKIHFTFPAPPKCGRIALSTEGLDKGYGAKNVVRDLSFQVDSGWKVAFVGPNGAGKSTLMRLVAGEDADYSGTLRLGSGVVVGYFAQDVADRLSGDLTVEQEAETVCPTELLPKLRNLLGAFLFRGDDVHKSVRILSGGERARLALLKMLLRPANLLVLDEPTNHLDLDSKDVLLDALRRFEGTVLFVSHDKFFIEGLADRVLELSCGSTPRFYPGDYGYFLGKKASLDADAAAAAGTGAPARDEAPAASRSWEEDKERKARLRKLRRREEEILARLDALAAQKAAAEHAMGLPENYSDGAKAKKLSDGIAALEREAASLEAEWAATSEEADGLEG
ncbi:MAG: ABC-F family ATP-binding cassette domain-containing protein [Spirochaetia bacterium]|nr:ABC-F family ATP-binding cassette domain-containing protein [Spirochaetia bacterium]